MQNKFMTTSKQEFCLYRKRLVRKHTRPAFETTRSFISFGKRNKWPCNFNQTLLTFYARLGKQGLYIFCYILFLTRFGYIWSKHIYFGYIFCLHLKFQCFVLSIVFNNKYTNKRRNKFQTHHCVYIICSSFFPLFLNGSSQRLRINIYILNNFLYVK